jgi:hypothetical protein
VLRQEPGQLEPLEIGRPELEPDFLAGVVARIKDRLNTLTEEQAAAQVALEGWRKIISSLETADDFNAHYADAKAGTEGRAGHVRSLGTRQGPGVRQEGRQVPGTRAGQGDRGGRVVKARFRVSEVESFRQWRDDPTPNWTTCSRACVGSPKPARP